ncbi:Gfo/Idh/MocA family protein [Winogradskyella arenosi]|uniref:Putative dehydrogenase n=1 Tax=Winogradskyella arenosi TaxID=533325 RepID=A0A368ZGW5_9FLAO|nr:Gfo/Idh/MocA family oxidoreductase [Winogradskyella arenosi]RCW91264.1 putative dehydrogenase [Winogradskyella arenosi]
MPKTIQWGIIGAGKIASKFARDLNDVPNANLYAIASRSLEKASKFKDDYHADTAYGSYEALVADPKIDAVYIATPHSFHKAHSILCLSQQKAVLCEKPFAMNLEEVEHMIQVAQEHKTLLMEAMWTLFLPHFQYVLQLIKTEHFGPLEKVEADFGFQPVFDRTSRVFDKSVGGGSLLDIGIYPIFAALATLGRPKTIQAEAQFYDLGADAECLINFEYPKASATLKSTFLEKTATEALFHCERGTIKIEGRFHQPSSVVLTDHNGQTEVKNFESNTIGYSYEIEHFNALLNAGKTESDLMTFDLSKQLIDTLDRVRQEIGLQY